ncbi:hypothetical protein JCM25156A_10190 [Komagataeibacter kakiaceti JCM 25156]
MGEARGEITAIPITYTPRKHITRAGKNARHPGPAAIVAKTARSDHPVSHPCPTAGATSHEFMRPDGFAGRAVTGYAPATQQARRCHGPMEHHDRHAVVMTPNGAHSQTSPPRQMS